MNHSNPPTLHRGLRVLIIEREHAGHRLSGVRVLLDALHEMDPARQHLASITLATASTSLQSLEFAEQLAPVRDRFEVLPLKPSDETVKPLRVAITKLHDVYQLVRSGQFDHVYLPYGDGLLQILGAVHRLGRLGWPKQVQMESIMMRGSFGYPQAPARTRAAALNALAHARLERIHLIDPVAYDYLQREQPNLLGKVTLLPDPISVTPVLERDTCRRALGLPVTGRLIGCVGRIDARKGCDWLIKSFAEAQLGPDDHLLLAGIHDVRIEEQLRSLNDARIVSINRYLTEQELSEAIGAVDVMATPYPNFVGSASIVIRAAAANRICVASHDGWMGHVVPRFDLGLTCDVTNVTVFANALVKALDQSTGFKLSESGQAFVRYGDMGNVHGHWTALLRNRLGLPPASNLQPWPNPAEPLTRQRAEAETNV